MKELLKKNSKWKKPISWYNNEIRIERPLRCRIRYTINNHMYFRFSTHKNHIAKYYEKMEVDKMGWFVIYDYDGIYFKSSKLQLTDRTRDIRKYMITIKGCARDKGETLYERSRKRNKW